MAAAAAEQIVIVLQGIVASFGFAAVFTNVEPSSLDVVAGARCWHPRA